MGLRMTPSIQAGIFAGESGGDYGALYGFSNRPGGQFADVDLMSMTVDQAIAFSDPSSPYAQWVKDKIGRVATPMGAYQVVGTTLRAAKSGLGLRGDELMNEATQDRIGEWILQNQGTGAWVGYKGPQQPRGARFVPPGKQPVISTQSKGAAPMQEKVGGLLGKLWPDMDPDRADRIRMGINGMLHRPNEGRQRALEARMAERAQGRADTKAQAVAQQQANRTAQWLATQPGGEQFAAAIASGAVSAKDALSMWQDASKGSEEPAGIQTLKFRAQQAGLEPGTPEYQRFMLENGRAKGLNLRVGADGSIQFSQGDVDGPQDVTAPASPEAMISSIDGILSDPALDFATGFLEWTQNIPNTGAARFGARVNQLNGQAFLRAFESLKGGGHITEIEGQKATEAIGRLATSQAPDDYRNALNELRGLLALGLERQRQGGKITSDAPGVDSVDINGTTYRIEAID